MESSSPGGDRQLLAGLCAALPALRERAEQGLWSEELEAMVGELRAGGSVTEVCRRLGLLDPPPGASRGEDGPGIDGAHLAGLAVVTMTGEYRCPQARCTRRGHRDDRARVPLCALTGEPMVPSS